MIAATYTPHGFPAVWLNDKLLTFNQCAELAQQHGLNVWALFDALAPAWEQIPLGRAWSGDLEAFKNLLHETHIQH